jgi:CarD family transcriptional regulator
MTFQKEDFVVYPRYGVGRVLGVQQKKFAGQAETCLGIQFEHQNLSLFIPLHRVEKVKLRRVMSKTTAARVLSAMKLRARFKPSQSHKERLKDYQGKFNSGDPIEMAEVARDLARLSKRQDLSMEEEGLCRESITLLAREIAVSKSKETIEVRENIERLLYR